MSLLPIMIWLNMPFSSQLHMPAASRGLSQRLLPMGGCGLRTRISMTGRGVQTTRFAILHRAILHRAIPYRDNGDRARPRRYATDWVGAVTAPERHKGAPV